MRKTRKSAYCASGLAALLLLSQFALANPFPQRAQQTAAAESEASTPTSDTPQDYTHTLPLTVSGKQGVVGFRLPQAVYLNAHSAGLNDLRVFDASGAKLAFALYEPPVQQQTTRRSLPVKIFPVKSNRQASSGDAIDLDIQTAADGTLLSVKTKSSKKPAAGDAQAPLAGLVLDARQPGDSDGSARPMIDALRFTLPAGRNTYSAQVWLEVSDDLKRWDTIGAAELSWLVNSDTQTLANDRLEFEPRSFRYARLTWRGGEPLQFASISAESVAPGNAAPALDTLLLQAAPGKQAQDLLYQAGLALPVEKIGLQFTEQNVVLPAAIGSYRELPSRQIGQPTTWQFDPFTRATFYQITQDGQTRRSGDIAVPLAHQAQWVLRPQAATAAKPVLRLSWQPATLVFLAGGNGPYTLAFGRDKVKAATLELAQVAPGFNTAELLKLEQATAGALQVRQGGPADDSNALSAGMSAQTRMWVLWGVLLFGVAVLGAMGWRLFKQMK